MEYKHNKCTEFRCKCWKDDDRVKATAAGLKALTEYAQEMKEIDILWEKIALIDEMIEHLNEKRLSLLDEHLGEE